MIEPAAVIAQARTWVGIPFLHQGRSRYGVDCLGFVACVMNELGVSEFLNHLPHNYERNPQAKFADTLPDFSREIPLQPAALLMIVFPFAKWPSHCAIYTGTTMIHCHEMDRKVVEHGFQEPWIMRTKSYWALPLVTYP